MDYGVWFVGLQVVSFYFLHIIYILEHGAWPNHKEGWFSTWKKLFTFQGCGVEDEKPDGSFKDLQDL